jgi:hypothetical protein
LKKPLAAVALIAASLATMAVPAGASPNKNWTVVTLPCRTGHKHATVGYSPTHPWWIPDPNDPDQQAGIKNPRGWAAWANNPCKGQWLVFGWWHGDPSEDSWTTASIYTGVSGHFPEVQGAHLADAPVCDVGGADRDIEAKDPNLMAHACDAFDNS